ncbi:ATP-binding protein [Chitinispirillales bacterium ANBcel5]|uniref:ATP-binding protein n=1 Tax=Cellulosispirillum alkaliphilum TaxID=3039283 RepID=UPI002A5509A7|nr:ATP-binding protein [Chitinispirillales bacterium ANBcel5]
MHYTFSDYIVDLVQNSIEAKSSLVIVDLVEEEGRVKLYISDNGTGMDQEELKKVKDPFFTDAKKHKTRETVGLGISFMAQLASQCGATFDVASEKGVGTSVFFSCSTDNPDMAPLGNIASAILSCINMSENCEIKFNRKRGELSYSVLKSELLAAVGDISDAQSLIALRKYLQSQEKTLSKKGT